MKEMTNVGSEYGRNEEKTDLTLSRFDNSNFFFALNTMDWQPGALLSVTVHKNHESCSI